MPAPSPLFGLVLAGGASTRMQRDKAALVYHDKPQLQWTYELLLQHCAAVFVSVRPDQRSEPTRAGYPQIVDREPGTGPLAGISAALLEHPKVAWLVVACDLPFVDTSTLGTLIAARDPQRTATAYRSSHDGLPEPLCAIWEPSARELLATHDGSSHRCPRKLLINANTLLLDLPNGAALDNVNTAVEFSAAQLQLAPARQQPPAATRGTQLKIQYYALFREQAGRSEELLETTATTPAQLYRELQQRYPFKLSQEQLKVAINANFSDWQQTLHQGDTVVFIPPVAGG